MSHPSHEKQINRLNKVAGQAKGIVKMIENERYCMDILTQLKAIKSALRSIESNIVETHLNHCVMKAISSKDKKQADIMVNEIKGILKSVSK